MILFAPCQPLLCPVSLLRGWCACSDDPGALSLHGGVALPTTGGLCHVLRAKRERDAVLSGKGPQVLGAERRREGPGPFRIVQEFSLDHCGGA